MVKNKCKQRTDTVLEEKDIETLHEKHWAAKINGRYHGLVRGINRSDFSSANSAEQ
jgi:hypothetical protein